MRRVTRVAAIAVAAAIALSGCTSGADTPSEGGTVAFEKKDPLVFGYSVYDFTSSYFQDYLSGVKDEAAELGIKIVTADSKSSQQSKKVNIGLHN